MSIYFYVHQKPIPNISNWNVHLHTKGDRCIFLLLKGGVHHIQAHTRIHLLHLSQMVDFLRRIYVIPILCNDASRQSLLLLIITASHLALLFLYVLENMILLPAIRSKIRLAQ